jgi:hypothetical protein
VCAVHESSLRVWEQRELRRRLRDVLQAPSAPNARTDWVPDSAAHTGPDDRANGTADAAAECDPNSGADGSSDRPANSPASDFTRSRITKCNAHSGADR